MSSSVNISYKYCTSRKNTYNADKINPMPILNIKRQIIGYKSNIKRGEKEMPSTAAKTKNIINISKKFISEETFFESRKIYFGTLIFVIIPELAVKVCIPATVDSLKYEKTKIPANI